MENQGAEEKAKKMYNAPVLTLYGKFLDLTGMPGTGPKAEGGSGMQFGGKGSGYGKGMNKGMQMGRWAA